MRTVSRITLYALWCLPSSCLAGFFVLGIVWDAPLAYIVLGLLPASALNVISILLSYWINRGTETVARWVWIGHVSVLFGVIFLASAETQGTPGLDASIIMTYVMLIAAFPISILAISTMVGVVWLVDHTLQWLISDAAVAGGRVQTGFFVLGWLLVVLAGYWQWFMFLPRVVARFRRGGRT
jgi:hypothetical protein